MAQTMTCSKSEKSHIEKYAWVCCLLLPFFLSILTYLNCLQNSFAYDDESTVVFNYFIRHWENFPKLFTREYFANSAELTYRPIVTFTYFIDHTFWQTSPFGYHLTNVLLHAANSVLFFLFAFQVFRKRTIALVSALLFSVFPVFSEAVNAIGFREDLLAFLFFLLAFLFYLKASQRKYFLYYPLSLFCYLCSLLSKEMAITLPLLIILLDGVFQSISSKSSTGVTAEKLSTYEFSQNKLSHSWLANLKSKFLNYYSGYFLVAIFYLLIRFVFLYNPNESIATYPLNSFFVNLLTMSHVLAYYIKLLFLPFPLNVDYVMPITATPVKISCFITLFLFISVGIILYRIRNQNACLFFSGLWFFIALIPVMNIIPLGNIIAERFLYIPGAGFCMFIASIFMEIHKKHIKYLRNTISNQLSSVSLIILFFLFIGYSYGTGNRNRDWKDNLSLWSVTVKASPGSSRAHVNLGNIYEKKGFDEAAFSEFQKALALEQKDPVIYNNFGIYYDKKGLFDKAVRCYQKSLELNPGLPTTYNNLGTVYTKLRKLDEAERAFKKAISLNYLYPGAHNNLGIVYYRKGMIDQAEEEFKTAIEIEPYHAEAHNDLGIVYFDKKFYDKAINEFQYALQLRPDYANAHKNLGVILLQHKNDKSAALFHLRKSAQYDPQQKQIIGIKKLIRDLEGETKKKK